jgi:hypothetical protein
MFFNLWTVLINQTSQVYSFNKQGNQYQTQFSISRPLHKVQPRTDHEGPEGK